MDADGVGWDREDTRASNEKRIKLVINGGALNPKGLAEKTHDLVLSKGLDLTVAYVEGDDVLDRVYDLLGSAPEEKLPYLDSENTNIHLIIDTKAFLGDKKTMPIVSANAYLGMRSIRHGLDEGADINICGRVADANPVIGAAAWWHGWPEDAFNRLAGALIASHLIECSTYATGADFAGFHQYETGDLLNLGLPIVEIDDSGFCVVTKHEELRGFVTSDTIKCQLLYELQGTTYLNSDVKAEITHINIQDAGKDRVRVSGVKGHPPPSTTKLAVFYKGGYQCEMLVNATGYATTKKFDLQEAQFRSKLKDFGILDNFDILEFQWIGRPEANPSSQLASTTSATSRAHDRVQQLTGAGFHSSSDHRTAIPGPYLGFYPAVISQSELHESVTLLSREQSNVHRSVVGPPKITEPIGKRENYDTSDPVELACFGETTMTALGDIALARSGDKGANVNLGIYVHSAEEWAWLRTVMSRAKLKELMGATWEDWFFIERCELPEIRAVHFAVYGPLGRGVTSSKILDSLGKGFADFIRDKHLPIPQKFLGKWKSYASPRPSL